MQNQMITALALKQTCNDYIHVKIASGNKHFFLALVRWQIFGFYSDVHEQHTFTQTNLRSILNLVTYVAFHCLIVTCI